MQVGKIPLRIVFSRLDGPSSLNLSSYNKWSSPFIFFVALHWTFSSTFMPLLFWGARHWTQHSRYVSLVLSGDHLPQSGDTLPDAAQGALGLLCCKDSLLSHVQLCVHQKPKFFCTAAFQLVCPSLYWRNALFLPFAEFQEILLGPFLQPVKVLLNGGPPIWCISHSSPYCVIWKCVQVALCPIIQVINEDVQQYQPMDCTTSDWPPAGPHVTDHNPSNLVVQPVFVPPHCPFM